MKNAYLEFLVTLLPKQQARNDAHAIELKNENAQRVKTLLGEFKDVKVIGSFNNETKVHVLNCSKQLENEKPQAECVFEKLKSCEFIETVKVLVTQDCDTSEYLALNFCDRVPAPYNGKGNYTLIYKI